MGYIEVPRKNKTALGFDQVGCTLECCLWEWVWCDGWVVGSQLQKAFLFEEAGGVIRCVGGVCIEGVMEKAMYYQEGIVVFVGVYNLRVGIPEKGCGTIGM